MAAWIRRVAKFKHFAQKLRVEAITLFWYRILVQNKPMIYGYARVSTDGQSVAAQVVALRKHGAGKVFREVASGAKTDWAQLRRLLDQLDGDVLIVTRLDRLGAIQPRLVDHSRGHHRQEGRFQIDWWRMGRHHHIAWPA